MTYYYYYQQNQTSTGPSSPGTSVPELTSSLPPLLLLPPQQPQLNLPLLTPVLPSVTTSTATLEQNQQPQLPTPNTFIRHCDDIGLFHDLQNIVIIPSLTEQLSNATATSPPITSTKNSSTIVTPVTSDQLSTNSFSLSSTAIVKKMLANPFDETFKQAVSKQQKSDKNLPEIFFNSNNNDGDLNTPFIAITTVVDTTSNNNHNHNTLFNASTNLTTTNVVSTQSTMKSITLDSMTMPQSQQQNVTIRNPTAEKETNGGMLVMMVEQQQSEQHNSVMSIQPQIHQQINRIEQRQQHPRIIAPAIPATTTSVVNTTSLAITTNKQDCYDEDNDIIEVESDTLTVKQTLKQNLLVKQMRQELQRPLLIFESHSDSQNVVTTNTVDGDDVTCGDNDQEREENEKEQLKLKHKQEMLERNRSAAKRSRMKRKQKWEALFKENKRLKIENSKLREILSKLINRNCDGLQ